MESIPSKIYLFMVAGAIAVFGFALLGISRGVSYIIRKRKEKKAVTKKDKYE